MKEGRSEPGYLELFLAFLKISLLGFGGPNVHLGLMLDDVVERRKWIDREHFLHLIGITNLLPGPNSSEVTIHIGYTQRGWKGALVTGTAFLAPTFTFVLLLSWLYFRFGTLPQVEPLFWGLKPVIVAIILWAGWRLGREAVNRPLLVALAAVGLGVTLVAGRWAVLTMAAGGLVTWGEHRFGGSGETSAEEEPGDASSRGPEESGDAGSTSPDEDRGKRGAFLPLLQAGGLGLLGSAGLLQVFWLHLWIGAVLFGGGYVLVALLEPYAVGSYGWLTRAEFLDGVALSQAVPGPISTLSAFVGYAAAGVPGAFLATAGIYLPAFAAVLLVAPHLERLRGLEPVRATLAGVSAVVAGAIVAVGLSLVPAAVPGWGAVLLLAAALVGRGVLGIPSPWLVLGGLAVGVGALLLA